MYLSITNSIFVENLFQNMTTINRQIVLRKLGRPSFILTRDFNRIQTMLYPQNNLTENDVINMYDYFQEVSPLSQRYPWRLIQLQDLDATDIDQNNYTMSISKSKNQYYRNGILEVETYPLVNAYGTLGEVRYLDVTGKILKSEEYDFRGFKSIVSYFGTNGKVCDQEYLSVTGEVKIKSHLDYDKDGNKISQSFEVNYHNQKYYFTNEDKMYEFFLQEIVDQFKETSVCQLVVDTPNLIENVAKIKDCNKFLYLHNSHLAEDNKTISSRYVDFFTKYSVDYNGIFCVNNYQRTDLTKRLGSDSNGFYVLNNYVKTDEVNKHNYKNTIFTMINFFDNNEINQYLSVVKKVLEKDSSIKFVLSTNYSTREYLSNHQIKNLSVQPQFSGMKLKNEIEKADLVFNPLSDFDNSLLTKIAFVHEVPVIEVKNKLNFTQQELFNQKNSILVSADKFIPDKIVKTLHEKNELNYITQNVKNTKKLNLLQFEKELEVIEN